jgi:hypothetical protein
MTLSTFPQSLGSLLAMPAVQHLQQQSLTHVEGLPLMNPEVFPAAVAVALKQLTSLNLACNGHSCIPSGVSRITALQALEMGANKDLQLDDSNVGLLAALPCLQRLDIAKYCMDMEDNEIGFSQRSVRVLFAIKARLPHLHLPWGNL